MAGVSQGAQLQSQILADFWPGYQFKSSPQMNMLVWNTHSLESHSLTGNIFRRGSLIYARWVRNLAQRQIYVVDELIFPHQD
jgi:hypothetical protein